MRILGIIAAVMVAVAALGFALSQRFKSHKMTTPDGRITIVAPAGWTTAAIPSPDAKFKLHKAATHGWCTVISESKQDFKDGMTLDDYYKLVMANAAKRHDAPADRTVSPPRKLTANGYPAIQCDVTATVNGVKFVYLRTMVETPTRFNQILLWTPPSHAVENQIDFNAISTSLKENPVSSATTTHTHSQF